MLRAIAPGHRVGIAWWLFPDESHDQDGKHITYLQRNARWRGLDAELFDKLRPLANAPKRSVELLERLQLIEGATYYSAIIPDSKPVPDRNRNRNSWFKRLTEDMSDGTILFIDPDNGFETKSFSLGRTAAGKSVSLCQLKRLAEPDRTLVVYHHQTRVHGKHPGEIDHWRMRLHGCGFKSVDVVRASAFSVRYLLS